MYEKLYKAFVHHSQDALIASKKARRANDPETKKAFEMIASTETAIGVGLLKAMDIWREEVGQTKHYS